jgi:hypothetical protein
MTGKSTIAHLVDMWHSFPAVTECIPELPNHKGWLAGLHVLCHMSPAEAFDKIQPAHRCPSDGMDGTLVWTRTPAHTLQQCDLAAPIPNLRQISCRLRIIWDTEQW